MVKAVLLEETEGKVSAKIADLDEGAHGSPPPPFPPEIILVGFWDERSEKKSIMFLV